MSASPNAPDSRSSAEALIEKAIAARGDLFPEWIVVARTAPATMEIIMETSGYLHKYEGIGSETQQLSVQMRELIAIPALCAKGDLRHAPNHVRRMYRLGVTNAVILESAAAFAVVAGWATMLNVGLAITEANSPDYAFGELPDGGEPKELKPFPELRLGRKRLSGTEERPADRPSWRYVATIDPELVRRISKLTERCLGSEDQDDLLLGPGPRSLIVVAGLCIRGEVESATRFIRRAYDYGMSKRQVLEAIAAVAPMTGLTSLEIGAEAMRLADRDG